MIKVFDGHNDTLLRLLKKPTTDFFKMHRSGHIDFPRGKLGGFAGGFFALFTPWCSLLDTTRGPKGRGRETGLFEPINHERALTGTLNLAAKLLCLERASRGSFKIIRSIDQLLQCMTSEVIGAIMHLEGAEAIDENLNCLEVLYAAGLRSLGITWSRENIFGTGVSLDHFPGTPDIGPGLTKQGRRLVSACNQLGILIDLSHLNEKGFWDVAALSDKPLVATHSNAHTLCQSPRNLTDKQLFEVAGTGGVVGINFGVRFLREDGKEAPSTPIAEIVNHVNYLVDTIGIHHVAFGSDFDGTTIPNSMGDVRGLPKLINALRKTGYGDNDLKKIASENWARVLKTTWRQ